jgi:hypothetical protein
MSRFDMGRVTITYTIYRRRAEIPAEHICSGKTRIMFIPELSDMRIGELRTNERTDVCIVKSSSVH